MILFSEKTFGSLIDRPHCQNNDMIDDDNDMIDDDMIDDMMPWLRPVATDGQMLNRSYCIHKRSGLVYFRIAYFRIPNKQNVQG